MILLRFVHLLNYILKNLIERNHYLWSPSSLFDTLGMVYWRQTWGNIYCTTKRQTKVVYHQTNVGKPDCGW